VVSYLNTIFSVFVTKLQATLALQEFQHLLLHLNVPVADNNVDVGSNTLLQQILQFLTMDPADMG